MDHIPPPKKDAEVIQAPRGLGTGRAATTGRNVAMDSYLLPCKGKARDESWAPHDRDYFSNLGIADRTRSWLHQVNIHGMSGKWKVEVEEVPWGSWGQVSIPKIEKWTVTGSPPFERRECTEYILYLVPRPSKRRWRRFSCIRLGIRDKGSERKVKKIEKKRVQICVWAAL